MQLLGGPGLLDLLIGPNTFSKELLGHQALLHQLDELILAACNTLQSDQDSAPESYPKHDMFSPSHDPPMDTRGDARGVQGTFVREVGHGMLRIAK